MLGCLEVVEYSLKERFNMKYLHKVSYLRLQDLIGVCRSYTRYHICVCKILLSIRCLSYYCLSGTTCVLVVVQYTAEGLYRNLTDEIFWDLTSQLYNRNRRISDDFDETVIPPYRVLTRILKVRGDVLCTWRSEETSPTELTFSRENTKSGIYVQ